MQVTEKRTKEASGRTWVERSFEPWFSTSTLDLVQALQEVSQGVEHPEVSFSTRWESQPCTCCPATERTVVTVQGFAEGQESQEPSPTAVERAASEVRALLVQESR